MKYMALCCWEPPCVVVVVVVGHQRRVPYLEDVTGGELEAAGGDVDASARLHVDAVHTLVAVVVVQRKVGG